MKLKSGLISLVTLLFILSAMPVQAGLAYNDPYLKYQKYLSTIGLDDFFSNSITGKGVIIAVLDSGVQMNNPDLKDALWRNTKDTPSNGKDDDGNGYVDDHYGFNFVDKSGDMKVYSDHGTAVAGIIAAAKNNGYGIVGIAPDVKIMPLVVCNSKGCPDDAIFKAIKYAADNGAHIINLSLGSSGTLGYTPEYDEVLRYAADKGVVVVASAGNSDPEGQAYGKDLDLIKESPVCNDVGKNLVIGVGAGQLEGGLKARWSSYGGSCVDIWAPGEDIVTLSVQGVTGRSFELKDGTSFSAPMVAATFALMKEKFPSYTNVDLISHLTLNSGDSSDGRKILNLNKALYGTVKRNTLGDVDVSSVPVNGKLFVSGNTFFSNEEFKLDGPNALLTVPKEAVKFYFNVVEIDLTKIPNITPGTYTISLMRNTMEMFDAEKKRTFTIREVGRPQPIQPAITQVNTSDEEIPQKEYALFSQASIRVRQSPKLNSKVVGYSKKKIKYEIFDDSQDEWIGIIFGKTKGYAQRKYVTISN